MDVNETLRQLREAIAAAGRGVTRDVVHIAELFDALDDWLKRGGYLPDDWERGARLRAEYLAALPGDDRREEDDNGETTYGEIGD